MKYVHIVTIYVGFFALIGFAIWLSNSLLPLWALLLTPSYSDSKSGKLE